MIIQQRQLNPNQTYPALKLGATGTGNADETAMVAMAVDHAVCR